MIAGGGYIANEFACIFNELGVKVNLVTHGDRVLRSYDDEIVHRLVQISRHKGIDIRFNFHFKSIIKQDDGSLWIENTDGSTNASTDDNTHDADKNTQIYDPTASSGSVLSNAIDLLLASMVIILI